MSGARAAAAMACGICLLGCRHEFPSPGDVRPADRNGHEAGAEGLSVDIYVVLPPPQDASSPMACVAHKAGITVSFAADKPPTAGATLTLAVTVAPANAYTNVMVAAHSGSPPQACADYVGAAEIHGCTLGSCSWKFSGVPVIGTTPPFNFTFIKDAGAPGCTSVVGTCAPP